MKIISLESIGLSDCLQDEDTFQNYWTTRQFRVGHKYDDDSSSTIISIDTSINGNNYIIRTEDGHKFVLPGGQYIAEYVEDENA